MLERSAIIAGWKVNGKSEQRYVKEVASRRLDASKCLGLLDDADNFIEEQPNTSDSEPSDSDDKPVKRRITVLRDDDSEDSQLMKR